MNKYNNKHLSLEDRIIIEKCISDGFRKFEISKEINKSPATVGKEILKNRKTRARDSFNTNINQCIYIKDCGICNFKCRDYKENNCYRRDRFVGACNNCPEIKKCKFVVNNLFVFGCFFTYFFRS